MVNDYKVETVGEKPTPYVHYAIGQRAFTGEVLMARTAGDAGALVAAMQAGDPRARAERRLHRGDDHGRRRSNATLLPARLAAQTGTLVGLVATGPRRHRPLRRDCLCRRPAHARNRHPHSARRRTARRDCPVMRQGLTVAGAGVLLGSGAVVAGARAISAGLYGVSAFDPIAWCVRRRCWWASAAFANYLPAHRASRVDPSIALRTK